MEPESLRDRLASYLERHYPDWLPSGELQRLVVMKTSYTGRTAVRRLQELVRDGVLEVGYRERNHAWYRWNAYQKGASLAAAIHDEVPEKPLPSPQMPLFGGPKARN